MGTTGMDVFRASMRAARLPNSHGGEQITQKEVQSALRSIVFTGNMSVDKDDYAAAKKYFLGREFDTYATDLAVQTAGEFIQSFAGRWPDVVNRTAPKFEEGKLYSISRANMPKLPAGYAWDLRGMDSAKPGNVFAVPTAMNVGNGYLEGKTYEIDRSNMPALPQGFAWALNGAGMQPGHVFATVVRA